MIVFERASAPIACSYARYPLTHMREPLSTWHAHTASAGVTPLPQRLLPPLIPPPLRHFDGSATTRGGIPLCFPQFGGLGPLGQHGFARNSTFAVTRLEDWHVEMVRTVHTPRCAG